MFRKSLLLSGLLFPLLIMPQVPADSLRHKTYDWFVARLESDRTDPATASAYAHAYLHKAKAGADAGHIIDAYKCLLHQSQGKTRITYADSMVMTARSTGSRALIGSAYLTRGIVFYDLKKLNEALRDYLAADKYISATDDQYLQNKVKFNIAQIKYYLGFYDEALSLFAGCAEYYQDEDPMPYLSSLHSLGLCYNRLGRYNDCSVINKKGIALCRSLGYPQVAYRFIHSEGINSYFTGHYNEAIRMLLQAMPSIVRSQDIGNEAVANFYLGKSWWALGRKEDAVRYFLKVDYAFAAKGYIRPDMRETYELLIGYYRQKGDMSRQLLFVDRLLKADKFLEANYKYLSARIHKEYDTKELQSAKAGLEDALHSSKRTDYLIIGTLMLAVLAMVTFFIYARKRNREKFNVLMQRTRPVAKPLPEGQLDLNAVVVSALLKHLDRFEKSKKFLEPDMTLGRMASLFNSNAKYVSKVILHHRGKKSIDYINDLKIEYIIEMLKENPRMRRYTIKALAGEAGFSTAQHFTRAFSAHTDLSPVYFIEMLDKEIR